MLTNNTIKLYQSLKEKKARGQSQLFLAEGEKVLREILGMHLDCPYDLEAILVDEKAKDKALCIADIENIGCEIHYISASVIKKISSFQSLPSLITVLRKKKVSPPMPKLSEPCIVLDGIQDPGNLGTIIRTSAWFGIRQIFCSFDTADVFNPKVIQSSMGAFLLVDVSYVEIESLLLDFSEQARAIYGTFLEGNSLGDEPMTENAVFLFGNEGRGIRPTLSRYVNHRITIPNFSETPPESLNVSIAHGIVCAAFRAIYSK